MARYIDAEEALQIINNYAKAIDYDCDNCKVVIDAIKDIVSIICPKADVVDVKKYNELRDDFISFACSGVNNLAPYCKNRCAECLDGRGWCRYGKNCEGFNPDGKRRDT